MKRFQVWINKDSEDGAAPLGPEYNHTIGRLS